MRLCVVFATVVFTAASAQMMNGDSFMHMMGTGNMPMMQNGGEMMQRQPPAESSKCSDFCSKTYSPHTLDKPDLMKSCILGCQLSVLTEMSSKDDNETSVKTKCNDDCSVAYPKDEQLKLACEKGCDNQPFGAAHSNVQISMDNPTPLLVERVNSMMNSVSGGSVFGPMSQMMNKMMSRLTSMEFSPKNIFQFPISLRDLDKETDEIRNKFDMFFKKSPLEDFLSHLGPGLALPDEDDKQSAEVASAKDSGKRQLNGESGLKALQSYAKSLNSRDQSAAVGERKIAKLGAEMDDSAKPVGNKGPGGRPILLVRMMPIRVESAATDNSYIEDGSLELKNNEPSPPIRMRDRSDEDSTDPDNTWIACLARQTGRLSIVSRYLLMLAMMLCIVSMMWICVTIIRTAPKRRLRQQQMMTGGDQEYLVVCGNESEKKSQPFFVETPTYDQNGPAVLLVPPMEGAPPPYPAVHSPCKMASA